jgi:hypothetical protein
MEPSGCNRWQPVANGTPQKRLRQAKTVAVGCNQLPESFHGKEGVDGSSPSEGSSKRKIPANRGFLLSDAEPQSTSGYRRDRCRLAAPFAKCLQIGTFPDATEHLLEREGLEDAGLGGRVENGLTERRSERLLWRQTRGSDWARSWGQVACCRGVDAGSRGDRGMSRKGWAASTCPSPARQPFAGWQAAHRS